MKPVRAVGLLATAAAFLAAGCGPAGPAVYRRSGAVTFNGQPVLTGKVYFEPDITAGGGGPSGFADIVDGRYDTGKNGRGVGGGPAVVRVTGYSRNNVDPISGFGTPLFNEYATKVELPAAGSEYDIAVPASAAKGLPKTVVPLDP